MDAEKFYFRLFVFSFAQIVSSPIFDDSNDGFNISSVLGIESEECYQVNTCDYAEKAYSPNCYCDNLCHIYDDCCIDHTSQEESKLQTDEITDTRRGAECMQLYGPNLGVFVVKNCLEQSQSSINVSNPENESRTIFDIIPVTSYNKTVYRNKYIAECSSDTEYTFWKLRFDIDSCSSSMRTESIGKSTINVAEFYLKAGCDYKVIPPDDTPPRFCILFIPTNDSSQRRIPILSVWGVYRDTTSCQRFYPEMKCHICFDSVRWGERELGLRRDTSINALFQFHHNTIEQERYGSENTAVSTEVAYRNLRLKRLLKATTSSKFDVSEWERASFFYQACIRRALIDFNPYLHFSLGIYIERHPGSNESHLVGFVDIFIREELRSLITLAKIENWLDGHKIQYSEISENRLITFYITTNRIENYSCRNSDAPGLCTYFGIVREDFKDSDIIQQMQTSKGFPSIDCLLIKGEVEKLKDRNLFSVSCKMNESPSNKHPRMRLLSIVRYTFQCLASVFVCTVLPCNRKCLLRKTIFGYSYLSLILFSFFNQSLTTFVAIYSNEEMCYFMKLTSRFLTFVNQTISILGNLSFINFMIKIKSTTNESFLKNRVQIIFFMGSSIVFPVALTFLVYTFSKPNSRELSSCDIHFLFRDKFTDAATILEIILIIMTTAGYIIYMKKGKEISLIKECVRYVFAYGIVSIGTMAILIVQYLVTSVDLQILTWLYAVFYGIQIPLFVVPLYFRN